MKMKLDKAYFKYSFYGFLTVAMSIIFYLLLDNMGFYIKSFSVGFGVTRRILSPFIIGASVAYLLSPGVRWLEKRLFNRIQFISKRSKLHRLLSILTMYIILISSITMLIVFVAPQIGNNISDIVRRVPEYITSSNELISKWTEEIETYSQIDVSEHVNTKINDVFRKMGDSLEGILNNLAVSILSITSGLLNFVLGLILSFYMLMDRESFKKGIEKILRVFLSDTAVEKVKVFGREVDDLFAKFIVGKSLDSFIIACLCFVGLKIMGIRYALLLSVIIGVTNMIPYFGPFIGAVPATIITFFDSPLKALWILIFILALQQFDGLILGPKILGDSVGVSPFWIIFSITVGGKLFGLIGMFLGVPVIAIIRLVINRAIDRQLERKNQNIEKRKKTAT
ncbi:AI-2E family transporter [Alkaliphilus peptidifermentans]|uniref:Predicted PurR-regulated permease PerM n=1 Tax=Alkaliphilus peptidifermentans DSM 18978 TaxID=1120976 RepID=A0A1G5FMI0_9FIRM|nr:AI-2E family transporter [Alkaliphilus peptidifermentans]SCY40469.1 Predicted PurR-regulated permease PerM [Alkaliphilus peptidifermentans DSM 18978]